MIPDLIVHTLPPGMEPGSAVILYSVSLLASFMTAAFGVGGGGLMLAVMATLLPAHALIPVHGVVQLGSNAGRMLVLIRSVHWPALGGFAAGSVIGSTAGGLIVVELPANAVQIGVGLFVIWSVFARPPAWLRNLPVVTGVISSFLTMFFGATGLFVASYAKALDLSRQGHVATHATLMTVQHVLKVIVFGLLGFAFSEWLTFILLMIVLGLLGTIGGRFWLERINEALFRKILNILLVLISLRLILAGLGLL